MVVSGTIRSPDVGCLLLVHFLVPIFSGIPSALQVPHLVYLPILRKILTQALTKVVNLAIRILIRKGLDIEDV